MRLGRIFVIWLAAALIALACAPAFAAGRVALIVANSAYQAAPLSNPATDAALVAPAFERMGFEVTTVTDVDLATFDRTLREFEQKAEGADIAAFYFAGHGFAVNDGINVRNYLMSTSADVTSRSDRVIRAGGIPLDEIVTSLSTSARTSLIFVDACRNDPRVRAGAGSGRGLAPLPGGLGNAVFVGLSTRLGDTASDGEPGKGSPFARAFAAHMAEPGQRVIDSFTRVRLAVAEETGADQNPEIARQDLTAPLVLVVPPPAVAEAPEEIDAQTAALNPDALAELVSPDATATPRALLLEETASGDEPGTSYAGTLEWTYRIDVNGNPSVTGNIAIPARKLTAELRFSRNVDPDLPADLLVDFRISPPDDFAGRSVRKMPGILLKNEASAVGESLAGAAATVTDNIMIFALTAEAEQGAANLALLANRDWIDVPLIYGSGDRAILTLGLGTEGRQVFDRALDIWAKQDAAKETQTASLTPGADTANATAPWMGVQLAKLRAVPGYLRPTSGSEGVVVTAVRRDGPANGKLRIGDVLTEINGTPVSDPTDLEAIFSMLRAGDRVVINVDRGSSVSVSLALGSMTEAEELRLASLSRRVDDIEAIRAHYPDIGWHPGRLVQVASVTDLPQLLRDRFGNPRQGVMIIGLAAGAKRRADWLVPGMIIDRVDLYDIESLDYFLDTAKRFRDAGMTSLAMRVRYQGELFYSSLPLEEIEYVRDVEGGPPS
ncbi:caspase family protein [Cucumibacter marinus]|uniref:caspase family protein n=1 Tax=Cucumibacter marinus TaxID=1121252 RepID=UPI0004035C94|nr:caspase family protein [Cucumibacter marinus]